jgi:hypothetical protein
MNQRTTQAVRLKLAWWELGLTLAQLVIGSALLFLLIGEYRLHSPWGEVLVSGLAYSAIFGQCLQLLHWLIARNANVLTMTVFALLLLVGLLDTRLVAAITLITALIGAVSNAETVGRLKSEANRQ